MCSRGNMRGPSRIPVCQGVALFQLVCCLLFSGNSQDTVLLPAQQESESLEVSVYMCELPPQKLSVLGCASEQLRVGRHLSSILGWDQMTFHVDWAHEMCVGCGIL